MRQDFRPAIEALQNELADLERKVLETKTLVNRLYVAAGEPAPYNVESDSRATASMGSIKADTFYGKSINTAAREYLDMRKSAGLGPATPRDVYEALSRGGLKFEAKDETNAIIGVRATLRKNSSVFHRLPTGEYGLLGWYPNAKAPKESDDLAGRNVKAKKHKKAGASAANKKKPTGEPQQTVAKSIENVLRGKEGFLKISEILSAMTAAGTPLASKHPMAHASSVLSRGKQFHSEKGKGWRLRSPSDAP